MKHKSVEEMNKAKMEIKMNLDLTKQNIKKMIN